jgi:hypothetical protein
MHGQHHLVDLNLAANIINGQADGLPEKHATISSDYVEMLLIRTDACVVHLAMTANDSKHTRLPFMTPSLVFSHWVLRGVTKGWSSYE